ncbi:MULTISPECIES: hypothetical protein [Catenuloplanes]|uniref:Poly(3-hydroxybutyrate) depolymerase n=1 Tax=Catenuloplanes niger TaxID=587534 RepID=A0AAE3ZJ22_9ACTN|nr:hypothetical protein [Catenuloplanes niger]MDR7320839.1 poly(3-hydroxybutyrate) depolymerase [Catenuloplanes niger]
MSNTEEIGYDEFPEAIRVVHAALLDPGRVEEAVPVALQLLAHGWMSAPARTEIARGWDRLGLEADLMVSMLFPDQMRYKLMVTAAPDDVTVLKAGQQLALAAADGLDVLSVVAGLPDERRWALATAAADLRSSACRLG